MMTFSATDIAILDAHTRKTLTVVAEQGRFGTFWAIKDEHGIIEAHTSSYDAYDRLSTVWANHKRYGVAA